ncbi:hypothetical protein GN958_ATG21343, partial [Phytophthora infestans]
MTVVAALKPRKSRTLKAAWSTIPKPPKTSTIVVTVVADTWSNDGGKHDGYQLDEASAREDEKQRRRGVLLGGHGDMGRLKNKKEIKLKKETGWDE